MVNQNPQRHAKIYLILGVLLSGAGLTYGITRWQAQPVRSTAAADPARAAQVSQAAPAAGAESPAPPEVDPGGAGASGMASAASTASTGGTGGTGGAASTGSTAAEPTGGAVATAEIPDPSHGAASVSGDGKGEAKGGEAKGPATIKLEPMITNLDEGDQLRYLKVSLTLELVPEAQGKVTDKLPRARHDALMYMAGLHLSDTQGLQGKQRILRELSRRIADALGGGVKHVFFDEFIVQ